MVGNLLQDATRAAFMMGKREGCDDEVDDLGTVRESKAETRESALIGDKTNTN